MPQVLSQEAVRSTVEDRVEETLVYRDAFRSLDASGINSDTIRVPNPDDVLAEPSAIEPSAEYPTTREDYTKIDVNRVKYGEMVQVPDEDVMDNVFDLVADHVDLVARQMAEFLDGQAFNELSSNLNAASTVSGDSTTGSLSFADAMAGVRTLEEDGFTPDMIICGPYGKEDLMTSDDFNRATDLGDQIVTNGRFGEVGGIDVMVSNTGDITQHNAYVVDTDYYGYEATWTPIETERERDFDSDTEKYKIRTHKGWKAIKSAAAVEIEG